LKKKNYTDFKTEDLLKLRKSLILVSSILAGMLAVLLILSIFVIIKNGKFSALSVIPFALSPIVLLNFSQVKLINKELELRNE
jgi:hypothetical protein